MESALRAADGLTLILDDERWRIAWSERDWLGPIQLVVDGHEASTPTVVGATEGSDDIGSFSSISIATGLTQVAASVRAYSSISLLVFRLEALTAMRGFGTSVFERPSIAWPAFHPSRRLAGGVGDGTRTYGHQYCEFALPVSGDANATGFLFAPHRPAVVEPLFFIAADGRTVMLTPLDCFHEQIIAVPQNDEGVRCGWHGNLENIPAGFASEVALWAAKTPRAALNELAALLRRRHGTRRRGRYGDDLVGKLSYWTDNGAVYYYRTAPGCDYSETLERAVEVLHESSIPIRAVQLDSWFYPHENLRPVSPEGAPLVPPSGMMKWEPRDDLFPQGFMDLQRRVRGLPLAFHSRHFSRLSPYFDHCDAWIDGEYAHPSDERLFHRLMEQAASWGAITYEQDWMVESFLGVRGLRAAPGRARDWQEGLDRAPGAAGLTLQWCMSTPADFLQTVTLANLASIRTSGDYRYLFDNGLNWVWFLHTNALARALGLTPFKDVFLSHGKTAQSEGEPYAEIEALLASLSTGPVGIGDEIGCTNRDLVMRTCREDGVLVKPDAPIAAIDNCFLRNSFLEPTPLVGETFSEHPAGRWCYVAVFNAFRGKETLDYRIRLAEIVPPHSSDAAIVYDWRAQTWKRSDSLSGSLAWQDWSYFILCPVLAGEVTIFGDVSKYATVGDRRVARIRTLSGNVGFDVLGAAGSLVEVRGWSATKPREVSTWTPGRRQTLEEGQNWWWRDGEWRVKVEMNDASVVSVELQVGAP